MALLKEQTTIRKYSKWSDVKKTIDADPRYKHVDSSSQKEEWFKDYIKALPDEDSVRQNFRNGRNCFLLNCLLCFRMTKRRKPGKSG